MAAAVAAFRERLLAGTWSAESAQVLLMLQDDPTELLDALQAALADDPRLAAAVDRDLST